MNRRPILVGKTLAAPRAAIHQMAEMLRDDRLAEGAERKSR